MVLVVQRLVIRLITQVELYCPQSVNIVCTCYENVHCQLHACSVGSQDITTLPAHPSAPSSPSTSNIPLAKCDIYPTNQPFLVPVTLIRDEGKAVLTRRRYSVLEVRLQKLLTSAPDGDE
ncbi:hypothetical protein L798_08940 [Zootermopsis nevadensis]|uniref:Uncharacterized protein n=1 Tax=Zootermopsis nevadensis TaxID=136037 RepID=A0A067R3L0_ZOONE|nr:hypothetical protein L798_08940 [Zootermopsis nevadensis]